MIKGAINRWFALAVIFDVTFCRSNPATETKQQGAPGIQNSLATQFLDKSIKFVKMVAILNISLLGKVLSLN